MTLKYLSVDEMIGITASWVDPSHADRKALGRMISVGGLLPLIDEAHIALLDAQKSPDSDAGADMTTELLAADLRHDSYVRVTWHGLEAHIQLATAQRQDHAVLVELRDRLLPDGLSLVDYSYREESAQARQLETRLAPEDKAILAGIPIADGTLLDAVDAWIAAGKELGTLQTERELRRSRSRKENRTELARTKWLRAVKTLRMVLELMDEDDPIIKAIQDKLERLEQRAEARMRAGHVRAPDADASRDS